MCDEFKMVRGGCLEPSASAVYNERDTLLPWGRV